MSLEVAVYLAVLSEPFLPDTSAKLFSMLNFKKPDWNSAKGQLLKPGHQLGTASLLFEKIEDDVIGKQIEKLKQRSLSSNGTVQTPQSTTETATAKPETSFDDFSKMDLRV